MDYTILHAIFATVVPLTAEIQAYWTSGTLTTYWLDA